MVAYQENCSNIGDEDRMHRWIIGGKLKSASADSTPTRTPIDDYDKGKDEDSVMRTMRRQVSKQESETAHLAYYQ